VRSKGFVDFGHLMRYLYDHLDTLDGSSALQYALRGDIPVLLRLPPADVPEEQLFAQHLTEYIDAYLGIKRIIFHAISEAMLDAIQINTGSMTFFISLGAEFMFPALKQFPSSRRAETVNESITSDRIADRMLLIGARGFGKTALCMQICYLWTQHVTWLAGFSYLFCVILHRDALNAPCSDLWTFLAQQYKMSAADLRRCMEAHPGSTLLLVDGLDLLHADVRRGNHPLMRAIRGVDKLSTVSIVVTAGLSLVSELTSNGIYSFNRQYEIQSISTHLCLKYTDTVLNALGSNDDDMVHLNDSRKASVYTIYATPSLTSMFESPTFANIMIADQFVEHPPHQERPSIAITMYKALRTSLVRIVRSIGGKLELPVSLTDSMTYTKSFAESLAQKLRRSEAVVVTPIHLEMFGKLGYQMKRQNRPLISLAEAVKALDGSRFLLDLGIMNIVLSSLYADPPLLTCSFVNHSILDFLVAFYIALNANVLDFMVSHHIFEASWQGVLVNLLGMIPASRFKSLSHMASGLHDQEDLTIYSLFHSDIHTSQLLHDQVPAVHEIRGYPIQWPNVMSLAKNGAFTYLDIQLPFGFEMSNLWYLIIIFLFPSVCIQRH
jgi:hypothetical protein